MTLPHNPAITVIDLPESSKQIVIDDGELFYRCDTGHGMFTIPPGNYKLICLGNQATEEEAREIVEAMPVTEYGGHGPDRFYRYMRYYKPGEITQPSILDAYPFDNPKDSLRSLITSNGWKNPVFLRKEG